MSRLRQKPFHSDFAQHSAPRGAFALCETFHASSKSFRLDFRSRSNASSEAAEKPLDGHFPRSLHDDIRGAIGLPYRVADAPYSPDAAGRDPTFRDQVLREYERRCAVCGFDVRIQEELLGLEAAHIKWHAAGGPDIVQNGLALCVIHHKALDRGAFGLESRDQGFKVLISSEVYGQSEAVEWLRDFHDRPLRPPQSSGAEPRPEFVKWHIREVFREPAWRPGPAAVHDRAGC